MFYMSFKKRGSGLTKPVCVPDVTAKTIELFRHFEQLFTLLTESLRADRPNVEASALKDFMDVGTTSGMIARFQYMAARAGEIAEQQEKYLVEALGEGDPDDLEEEDEE